MMKPFLNVNECIADGEARLMPDGKVYLYGSLDTRNKCWCSDRYVVLSSEDLQKWQVSPTSFSISDVPWAKEIILPDYLNQAKSYDDLPKGLLCFIPKFGRIIPIHLMLKAIGFVLTRQQKNKQLYAPDCIHHNGKYYLYFCLSDGSEGVAVSDNPNGPFKDVRRLPVNGIDPSVFIDDDGQGYYYWGQFSSSGAKLNPDLMSIDESSIVHGLVDEDHHHFHEGSSMRKRNGIYYYVFADIHSGKPSALSYATSNSPLGPFTYRGVIIDNEQINTKNWNNHGSIEEINGQWYVFFHSATKGKWMRKACMLPITFDDDGLIRQINPNNHQ